MFHRDKIKPIRPTLIKPRATKSDPRDVEMDSERGPAATILAGIRQEIHLPRLVLAATRGGVLMCVVDESQEITDEDKSEKQSL